jgi:NSS family neurotransmitter:Na+ symporter
MLAHCLAALADVFGLGAQAAWLTGFAFPRNLVFMLLFMVLTIAIISAGVRDGIERWSSRLMPALLATLLGLVVYVLTLDGAIDGVRVYLLPDFSAALSPQLIIKALGAAFFSLSLGVGTMLIYGSYISDRENLPVAGGLVTLVDIGIAVLAGFLVLPAMYVALHNGVQIYTESGSLISEDTLIFTVLPELFTTMGAAGAVVSFATFFFLMTIASLTSSISMLEVPVAYTIENHGVARQRAVWVIGSLIAVASLVILLNFSTPVRFRDRLHHALQPTAARLHVLHLCRLDMAPQYAPRGTAQGPADDREHAVLENLALAPAPGLPGDHPAHPVFCRAWREKMRLTIGPGRSMLLQATGVKPCTALP